MLDPELIQTLSEQIQRQFPQVAGRQPTVRAQYGPAQTTARQAKRITTEAEPTTYLLTFNGRVELAEHMALNTWVRVVVSSQGQIIKITTSR
jgi:hypothetical protein